MNNSLLYIEFVSHCPNPNRSDFFLMIKTT